MTLVVETGAGLANAESYVSAADCAAYAADRGVDFDDDDLRAEPALRRATAYIDATYRARFSGYPVLFGTQALEWPRIGAFLRIPDSGRSDALLYPRQTYPYPGWTAYLPSNIVPPQIIKATCEGAIREFAEAGVLAPDLDRGNAIDEIQAGSVRIRYGANAPRTTIFQVIDQALMSLLMPSNSYSSRAVRG